MNAQKMRSDQSIAHYGVKGMRWGVRNTRPQKTTLSNSSRSASTKMSSLKRGGQNVSKFLKSDAGQITMSVAAAAVAKYGTERITKRLLTNMIYGKPTNLPAIGPRAYIDVKSWIKEA